MSVESVLSRIAEIQAGLAPPATAAPTAAPGQFATALSSATASMPTASAASAAPMFGVGAPMAGGNGGRMVQIAQAEVGQAEMPPGSNDSPRIGQYRSAVAG